MVGNIRYYGLTALGHDGHLVEHFFELQEALEYARFLMAQENDCYTISIVSHEPRELISKWNLYSGIFNGWKCVKSFMDIEGAEEDE